MKEQDKKKNDSRLVSIACKSCGKSNLGIIGMLNPDDCLVVRCFDCCDLELWNLTFSREENGDKSKPSYVK